MYPPRKKKNQNFSILNQTFSNLLHLASLARAPGGVYERRDIVVRAERQLSDKERILSAYHIWISWLPDKDDISYYTMYSIHIMESWKLHVWNKEMRLNTVNPCCSWVEKILTKNLPWEFLIDIFFIAKTEFTIPAISRGNHFEGHLIQLDHTLQLKFRHLNYWCEKICSFLEQAHPHEKSNTKQTFMSSDGPTFHFLVVDWAAIKLWEWSAELIVTYQGDIL